MMPEALINPSIDWYYHVLGHVLGTAGLCQTLRTHFWIRQLKEHVDQVVLSCNSCQCNKNPGPGQGHLPPRQDVALPWEEVAVDLMGPWKVTVPDTGTIEFFALMMIDTTTTLAKIVRIENKTSQHVAMQFENAWLARYPRPLCCVHDPGSDFIGAYFQSIL
jgi:hypothetical protein